MSRFIESCGRIPHQTDCCCRFARYRDDAAWSECVSAVAVRDADKGCCSVSHRTISISWMGVVGPALTRRSRASDVSEIQLKRNVACQQPLQVETACIAAVYNDVGGRGIACAPRTLLLLVRSAAWYALARRPAESYTAFSLRIGGQINEAAFYFADGQTPDATTEQRLSRLPHSEGITAELTTPEERFS